MSKKIQQTEDTTFLDVCREYHRYPKLFKVILLFYYIFWGWFGGVKGGGGEGDRRIFDLRKGDNRHTHTQMDIPTYRLGGGAVKGPST